MTDRQPPTTSPDMRSDTDTSITPATTADQRSRVERLQRRRSARLTGDSTLSSSPLPSQDSPPATATSKPPATRQAQRARHRHHPASGARSGAAGLGVATMLGLVGVMGLSRTPSAAPTASATDAPSQVVVVIHRTNTTTPTRGDPAATSGTTGTRVSGPITLRTRPTVRPAAQPRSTPSVHTNGSR